MNNGLNNGHTKADRVRQALTRATDLILSDASIYKIEAAQKKAYEAGATDEEWSEAVWNARRIAQGMTP